MTIATKRHLNLVAGLGCIICRNEACCHHIRAGQGMAQKSSDYECLPLCWNHHQGPEGIHHLGTKRWQKIYGDERDLLAKVMREIYGEFIPEYITEAIKEHYRVRSY